MGAAQDPDPELVYRAYRMWCERASLREIGSALGRAPETVRRYIAQAQAAEQWRQAQAREARTDRMGAFLNSVAAICLEELQERDPDTGARLRPVKDTVPSLMMVVREINRVEGNYAPIRTTIEGDRPPADPALVALMEAHARQAEQWDEQEMREIENRSSDE
jgi:hypothetical protein